MAKKNVQAEKNTPEAMTKNMLIYVVIADYHHECCENVAVYDNAADAEATAEKLRNAKWEYWGPNEIYVESYGINSINKDANASEGLK